MARPVPFFPLAGLMVTLLAAGCGKAPEQAAQQGPPPPSGAPTLSADMHDHFTKVRDIEEAIIRGDVEDAREPARWLADHQETANLPAGTDARVADMKASARSVANSNDLGNAAIAAATLVGNCGSCHAASKVTPKFPELQKASAADTKTHMLEHQYAVDRLYRGLVSPSSDEWRGGAAALKEAPLVSKTLPPEIIEEAKVAEARIRELADHAANAAEKSSRVAVYGSIIGACANCHGLHGKVWGPGMPKTD